MSNVSAGSPSGPGEAPKTHYSGMGIAATAVILVVGIFASTMPQPAVLGKIPLQNFLKNTLHQGKSEVAGFFFLIGLFWYLKPIAGILTDAFPLFKTRRRHYLLISSVLAALSWIGVALAPKTYTSLLYGTMIVNLFMVMISTVIGAFLVEIGQSRGATGRLTGVRQITMNVCTLIQGPLGGMLAGSGLLLASGVNAVLVISIWPVAYLMLKERPEAMMNRDAFQNARVQWKNLVQSKPFWMSIAFLLLFYFAPGFSTLLYFRQNDILKLSQQQIGYLGSLGGLGGILAGLVYVNVARRIAIKLLLVFSIITTAVGTLLYLFYNSYLLAFAIDFQNGFFFGLAETTLLDLAARGTPAGCEGLGYSLMMSARNLALFGADYLGAKLSEEMHLSWSLMVWVNALSTVVVLVLLPFMPRKLMTGRDGSSPNMENTGEPQAA